MLLRAGYWSVKLGICDFHPEKSHRQLSQVKICSILLQLVPASQCNPAPTFYSFRTVTFSYTENQIVLPKNNIKGILLFADKQYEFPRGEEMATGD